MRTEITIHGAKPAAHRSSALIWLKVPMVPTTPGDIVAEVEAPSITLFFDSPADAAILGRALVDHAERAQRILAAELEPTAQEVAGR